MARLLLYAHYSDKGEFDKAGEYINAAVEVAEEIDIPPINPSIFLEKAFWEVFYYGNGEKAQYYFDKGKNGYSEKSTLNRAQTSLSLVKENQEEVTQNVALTRKKIGEPTDKGEAVWQEHMLNLLLHSYKDT